jgi:hypothetical protein
MPTYNTSLKIKARCFAIEARAFQKTFHRFPLPEKVVKLIKIQRAEELFSS